MIRWTQALTFVRQPRCPLCQENLQQGCWSVRGGIAFCHTCAETTPPSIAIRRNPHEPNALIALLAWWHTTQHGIYYTEQCGIRFYTPHESATRRAAAHLDPWLGGLPRDGSLADGYVNQPEDFDPHPIRCQEDH